MAVIIFDIETGPLADDELERLIPPFDPESVKCGNLKDPEKIAAKIAEAEGEHRRQFIERAALSPLTGQVLAIGYLGQRTAIHGTGGDQGERELLGAFWRKYLQCRQRRVKMVGHNIESFDVPFLVRRSWIRGVEVPDTVFSGRYIDGHVFFDTMRLWQCGSYRDQYASLDSLARAFGVGGKPDGTSGADFARLWNGTPEEREQARAYLLNDLQMTAAVAERMGIA